MDGRPTRWLQTAARARRSLLTRITFLTVVLVLVLSFVSAQLLGLLFARTHEQHARLRSQRFSDAVEATFRSEMEQRHGDPGPFLKLLCRASSKSALVTDRDGRVRFACDDALLGTVLDPPAGDTRVIHAGTQWVRRIRPVAGGPGCAACHAERDPVGYFAVDSPVEEADTEVREQTRMNLVSGAVLAVLLSAALVLAQILLLFRPMKRIAAAVGRIRAGDLSARVATRRADDELGRLGASVDEMAASIEQARAALDRTHRAELAQSEKLAALGQLVSSIAHEIKNPLTGIIGALRVLEVEAPAERPEKAVLGKILAQMERLSRTVISALDFARPLQPSVSDIDVVDLVERAIFFVERQAAEQHVELRKRYAPARARVDPDLVRQVFLNVLLNAIQAMPRGGVLEVEVRRADPGTVEVAVSDQGAGISPEHLERLFTPFFTTKEKGTGLGLYVARQIVEAHGGRIRVAPRPAGGTRFAVTLPAQEAAAHAAG